MINKMKERRKWNNKNNKEERKIYRQINNELRRETDKAIAAYWDRVCEKLEDWNAKERTDLVYAKVARLTWKERA